MTWLTHGMCHSFEEGGIRHLDPSELQVGTKEEMEHTDDVRVAERIALDHLHEDPSYYSKLKKAGLIDDNSPLS